MDQRVLHPTTIGDDVRQIALLPRLEDLVQYAADSEAINDRIRLRTHPYKARLRRNLIELVLIHNPHFGLMVDPFSCSGRDVLAEQGGL